VVDGLASESRKIPLVILRAGTENLVAKEFQMPTDAPGVVQTLLAGQPVSCDLGVINDRYFLVVAGAGFDAEVVHRLAAVRRGHITHLSYYWPIWRSFWSYRFPELTIEADGRQVFSGYGLAFVGVMSQYSLDLRILRHARRDDGMLDLCVLPCRTRVQLLRYAVDIFRRRHDRVEGVIYQKCRRISIAGRGRVPLEIDGDVAGHLPAECSILPAAMTFLTPR